MNVNLNKGISSPQIPYIMNSVCIILRELGTCAVVCVQRPATTPDATSFPWKISHFTFFLMPHIFHGFLNIESPLDHLNSPHLMHHLHYKAGLSLTILQVHHIPPLNDDF